MIQLYVTVIAPHRGTDVFTDVQLWQQQWLTLATRPSAPVSLGERFTYFLLSFLPAKPFAAVELHQPATDEYPGHRLERYDSARLTGTSSFTVHPDPDGDCWVHWRATVKLHLGPFSAMVEDVFQRTVQPRLKASLAQAVNG